LIKQNTRPLHLKVQAAAQYPLAAQSGMGKQRRTAALCSSAAAGGTHIFVDHFIHNRPMVTFIIIMLKGEGTTRFSAEGEGKNR